MRAGPAKPSSVAGMIQAVDSHAYLASEARDRIIRVWRVPSTLTADRGLLLSVCLVSVHRIQSIIGGWRLVYYIVLTGAVSAVESSSGFQQLTVPKKKGAPSGGVAEGKQRVWCSVGWISFTPPRLLSTGFNGMLFPVVCKFPPCFSSLLWQCSFLTSR